MFYNLFNREVPSLLQIRVTPKAARNSIQFKETSEGNLKICVYITAVAENGKANKAVIDLLAKELNLPKTAFKIIRGLTSRDKTIAISSS